MNKYPEAEALAHPECPEHILQYADMVGSTSKIIDYAVKSDKKQFIILTEPGIIHEMEKLAPDKEYIQVPSLEGCSCNMCPFMRLNTIDKMISALEKMEPQILIAEDLRLKALKPLDKMLEMS
jgi:quinolinate synthase